MIRLAFLLALSAAACATDPDVVAAQRYMCADGTAFFARYHADAVVLDFGSGRSKTLAAQPGGGYGSDGDEFRVGQSIRATLVRAGRAPISCRRGDIRDLAEIR